MEVSNRYTTDLSKLIVGEPKLKIEKLFTDSRQKVKNGMFFCVKGLINDGHNYVVEAIENGAVCVVHADDLAHYLPDVHYIQVDNVLDTLNAVAAAFYNYPSDNLEVFGVTGTNGKTTVAFLLNNILNKFKKSGYIGTINIQYDNKIIEALHTTPDVLQLQKTLADMVKAGVKAVSIEISSHSLEQKRTQAVAVDYAIFTNLSHEHLDYHGTMDNYFESKLKLFTNLNKDQKAIVNLDDKRGMEIVEKSQGINITYAIDQPADYQAINLQYFKTKTLFDLLIKDKVYPVETNLVAKFNIYNLLAVFAALIESGLEIKQVIKAVKNLVQVDGRVDNIELGQKMSVIVDYAHTPDGFEKIFQYANEIKADNRIIAVFGSAGERDIIKRSILGKIADKYCDMIILTEEDPRKESVTSISNQIAEGIEGNYVVIENRYDAIYQSIELANEEDIILILGKGNEKFMDRLNGREFYLGDGEIAKKIIREYLTSEKKEDYYE